MVTKKNQSRTYLNHLVHTYIHTHIRTYTYTYITYIHTYIHTYVHTHYVLACKVFSQASWSLHIKSRVKISNFILFKLFIIFHVSLSIWNITRILGIVILFTSRACTYEVPTYTHVIIQVFRLRSAELQDAIIRVSVG